MEYQRRRVFNAIVFQFLRRLREINILAVEQLIETDARAATQYEVAGSGIHGGSSSGWRALRATTSAIRALLFSRLRLKAIV